MIRRPPRSTLFPYTTSSDLNLNSFRFMERAIEFEARRQIELLEEGGKVEQRSEEHTSELQSPDHLVCRLLLEKKKTHYDKLLTLQKAQHNEHRDSNSNALTN